MSQAAIGKAALVLSVNGTGMRSGLAGTGRDVRKWADDVGRGLSSRMGAAGRSAGASAGGGLLSGLSSGAARVVGPIAAAAGGLMGFNSAVDTLFETARSGAAAKAFGLTAERFTGIQGLARTTGEQSREFIESLVTLTKLSDEGARGVGTVAPEWFRQLNLDAKEFNKLPLDEKFFKVFEAIHAAGSEVDKVRAVMAPFGEDGGKFLFTLTGKAPAELRRMAASFAISAEEVEKATRAHEAYTKAQTTLSAAWRGGVIAAAPLFERISGWITGMQPQLNWFNEHLGFATRIVDSMLEQVGQGVSWAAEKINTFAAEIVGLTGVSVTAKDVIVFQFRAWGNAAALTWDVIKAGAGVAAIAFGMVIDSGRSVLTMFREIVDLGRKLPDAIRPEGLDRFADDVSAVENRLRGAGDGLKNWGVGAVAEFGGTLRQFNQWFDGVANQAEQRQERQAERAVERVQAMQQAAVVAMKSTENEALLKGSSAEVSMRIRNDFSGSSPQERMLEQQKVANRHLEAMKGGIGQLVDKVGSGGLLPL